MNISTFIEDAYKTVIEEYRKTFKHRASNADERTWIMSAYPHLMRDSNINPILYDMNVNSYESPLATGICMPVALFVKSYMKDVHDVDVEMIGLWEGHTFCHCVIKYEGKYYDAFWPEGTTDSSKILFADECVHGDVERIINLYRSHEGAVFLKTHLFDAVKSRLYTEHDKDQNFVQNLEQIA